MTILQFFNAFFYFLLFPYLVYTIGKEAYGLYVFAFSIVTYCISFIDFGFALPNVKIISENQENAAIISKTVSSVISSKICLFLGITPIFAAIVYFIPMLREYWLIYALCYIQIPANILFQSWFFQGIQKMKIVTGIQVVVRMISLAFIFTLVKTPDDLWLFVLITSCTTLAGGICGFILTCREKVKMALSPLADIKLAFKDALPFFFSLSAGIVRHQANAILLGAFFTMEDVATYDLGYKIITIPIVIFSSLSGALFPKVVKEYSVPYIKKLININVLISILSIFAIIIVGKYIVVLMGGMQMESAYYFVIIMSITILSWLVIWGYINFLFVPNKLYYVVTKNQLVAFISYFSICFFSIFVFKTIFAVAVAMAVSGISELIYCNIVIRRKKLLIA